jgi:hypothetical protein
MRKDQLEEYLIEKLKEVDPRLFPKIRDELKACLRRRELRLIKGARYEPPGRHAQG